MEKKKKISKKKRSFASSLLSYLLVFAMVLTNVQPAQGAFVWAAENETELSSELTAASEPEQGEEAQSRLQERSETVPPSEAEEVGETVKTDEILTPSETVTPSEAESSGETVAPSETEAATETSGGAAAPSETEAASETVTPSEAETSSETVAPSETEAATETVTSGETEAMTETVTETEEASETSATAETETETEIETETEQMTADAEELVTVKAHFKNVTGWEAVALHHWGGGIDGTEWPGVDVTEKDQDGYYIVEIPNVKRSEELGIIFNNKDGSQTSDIKIPATEFTSETYEVWVWVDEANGTGWSTAPFVSPAIERNTVTFRYMNGSAETVLVAGSMNDWTADPESEKAIKMTKGEDGIFTYKTKLQRGDYEYKFVVLGEGDPKWTTDPNNSKKLENGNSAFGLTTLLSPEIKGYDATFYYESDVETVLVAGSMNDWTEDPESAKAAKMTKNADGLLTYTFTSLEPGDYTYKFIEFVDGNKNWITDPNNDLLADDGFGGKNSLFTIGEDISKTYEYTIHYYNPAVAEPVLEGPDLLIWNGNASSSTGKPYLFTEMLDDTENSIKWLTMTVKVPYKKIGMNGRPRAGKTKKDADRTYTIANGDKAELWYVYGKGIYEKKPAFGKVEKAEASLSSSSMNYTQNNVLSLKLTGVDGVPVTGNIREAYVDASDLGMSRKLYIDPELLAVTLSVRENVAAGTYTLPVTVKDFYNNVIETSVNVEVTAKEGSSFDWDEAVIYFMVTDRFFDGNADNNAANGANTYGKDNAGLYHGGDFAGVTQKLDYLKDLGVNTIWITPVVDNISGVTVDGEGKEDVPFNAAYHGYWASDFTKLDPALGTEDEFKALISAAHDKGIKIMVDVVLNHAGYGQEEYFNTLLKDAEGNPIQMIRDDSQQVSGSDQQASLSGLPDFLTENEAVRNQLVQWQVDWMKNYDIDYFRVDTVKHVDSTTWSAFKNELTKANPAFKMIGEYYGAGHSWNGGALGSGQMDSVLDFNFNDYATDFVKGNLSSVENNLRDRNNTLNNTYMTGQFLSSHDEEGFKQNLINQKWDQQAADAAALVAATLQITAKGQPVIYYGEEIGQTGKNNYPYQTNRYDFNWEAATSENSVYSHYNTLLKIRNQYTDLFSKGDRQSVAVSDAEGYDVVSRSYNGETIYIGLNIKGEAKTITIPVKDNGVNAYEDLYGKTKIGTSSPLLVQEGKLELTIPAAKDGGTVILVPSSFKEGLIAPQLTIIKGKETVLPKQLVWMSEDGVRTNVDVVYTMESVEGVRLDDANKKLMVETSFEASAIELTATTERGVITFSCKVYADDNKITLKIHYHRADGNYEGWNVWGWRTGAGGAGYEFADENNEKIVTIELDDARTNSDYNYIVRKRVGDNDWAEKNDESDQKIDLSDVLSGTVHFYIEGGTPGGNRVLGEDALTGAKIKTVDYDAESGYIIVKTGLPIEGNAKDAFKLMTDDGEIALKKVYVNNNVYELVAVEDLTSIEARQKSYTLLFDGYEFSVRMPSAYSSDEFEEQYTYDGNDLGATWTSEKTTFKVWAPTADHVQLKLYESGTQGTDDCIETLDMTKGKNGVWSVEKEGDQNGVYYTYNVTVGKDTREACDPYAVTTGVNGNRAMVINLDETDPEGWAQDRGASVKNYTDAIIYELHVRDFSIDESSGIKDKGKFLGLTEKGTRSNTGQVTGLDYLVDLGVTHLHLLPSYDYATVDETQLDKPQYNWGYDPKNYNVPEGSYSTDPYNGAVRVKEMKQMVKTLHDNDINVIMDVVYNHVYSAEDFCFNQIVPQYFSRTNEDGSYSNGSGCGNDTASERAMVKKYIVDSVNYWADEYHIDGFRFDLVGLIDTETINEVVSTVHEKHPEVVFYGEGWDMSTTVTKDGYTMSTQKNSAKTPGFAYFSDTIRDMLKGSVFDAMSTGFISGQQGREEDVAKSFMAVPGWTSNPTQIINYASCHDNYTLKDKLNVSREDATEQDRIRMNNLAAAIYMTSEGIPLIHAGEEILRTKVDENGNVIHNSYNSSDYVNSIKWSDLDKEEYRAVRDYYKGLIEFRKYHAALRLTSAADVKNNINSFTVADNTVMFVIKGRESIKNEVSDGIIVIFNADPSEREIDLYNKDYGIAEGRWNICINDKKAGASIISSVDNGKVKVAPISALVLVKGEKAAADSIYVEWAENSGLTVNDAGEGHVLYTGKAFKPSVKVYDGGKRLKEKQDYTLSYTNNVNAGIAVVTVKGKGNYSETVDKKFTIDSVALDTIPINNLCKAVAATNTVPVPLKPVVKYNNKTLKLGKDYTVAYENPDTDGRTPGIYNVIVEGTGNFTGKKIIKMALADKATQVLMNSVKVGKISDQEYNKGEKVEPALNVTYKGSPLTLGTDYTVTYSNNTEAGVTACAVITGVIGSKYVGDKIVTFKIKGQPLKGNAVSIDVPNTGAVYTGKAIEPKVQVTGLEENQYRVTYQNNKEVGKATVVVTGRNGYSGTVKKTFKILPYDISGDLFTFGVNKVIKSSVPYAKGGSKLSSDVLNAGFTIGDETIRLEEGQDYTLSYKKNKAVGKATVTIKGKGNFKGTVKDVEFEIAPQNIKRLTKNILVPDVLANNAEKYNKVTPVITDLDEKKLKNGKDFTIEEITNLDGSAVSGTPEIGKVLRVTVKGAENYTGTAYGYYRVIANDKNIAKAVITVANQQYTGKAVEPDKSAIKTITLNGETLEQNEYEIIGYSKNIKKGTAKMTIHGLGEYGGTKTVNFKIVAKELKW